MMANKRPPRPYTTAAQRRLLFETWEATGEVGVAVRRAGVARRTFNVWWPRFIEGGYAALECFADRTASQPRRAAPQIEQQVIALHEQHPDWGKRRLASSLDRANNGVRLVSDNTVQRILRDAGLWGPTRAERRGNLPA